MNQRLLNPHCRKGKDPRRFGIDLKINRNASCKERGGIKGQMSGIQIPKAMSGIQAIDNPISGIRKLKILPQNLVFGIATMVG